MKPETSTNTADDGLVPWAWTANRDDDCWQPAGNSRDMALAIARPKAGRRKFWIARCRRTDAHEIEEYGETWIVDPNTEEMIVPNPKDEPRGL